VRRLPRSRQRGLATLAGIGFACCLGRAGVRALKREGDDATPSGRFEARLVLYRADRLARPATALPVRPIAPWSGWCDAAGDRNYNRPVRLPYPASAEALWRPDHVYDLVLVLSHNQSPRVQGLGSAVFVHLAAPDRGPTTGCVALERTALLRLLRQLGHGDRIVILPQSASGKV